MKIRFFLILATLCLAVAFVSCGGGPDVEIITGTSGDAVNTEKEVVGSLDLADYVDCDAAVVLYQYAGGSYSTVYVFARSGLMAEVGIYTIDENFESLARKKELLTYYEDVRVVSAEDVTELHDKVAAIVSGSADSFDFELSRDDSTELFFLRIDESDSVRISFASGTEAANAVNLAFDILGSGNTDEK